MSISAGHNLPMAPGTDSPTIARISPRGMGTAWDRGMSEREDQPELDELHDRMRHVLEELDDARARVARSAAKAEQRLAAALAELQRTG